MREEGQAKNRLRTIVENLRKKESLLWRNVLWLEVLVIAAVILSIGLGSLSLTYEGLYNIVLVFLLFFSFVFGFVLFLVHDLQLERQGVLMFLIFLIGCLLVSYSTLIYQSGTAESLDFALLLLLGTILTVSGVGLMVVRLRQTSRLTGYYSMWLFGILLIMFMPLHELGFVLHYSGRDLVIGYLGLGISIIGAISFAIEQRLVLNVESWVTSGDAKYISGKFDEAIEYYDQVLGVDTLNEYVWSSKGATLLKLGLWAEAIDCFDKAIDLDPDISLAYSGKGLALTYLKRYSEALESHEKAIESGRSPIGWNNKGNTLLRMGARVDEALLCYENALKVNPEYEVAWFNKGKAEMKLGRYEAAAESFTRAVDIKPEFSDAWFQKGKALVSTGASEEKALFCYDTAIQLKPASSEAWMERKILLLAMEEKKLRPIPIVNIPETGAVFGPAAREKYLLPIADQLLEKSTLSIGKNGYELREEALNWAVKGRYDKSIEILDTTISRYPDDAVTYMTKGVLLSRVEQFEGALAAFDNAIEIKPEWVGPWFSKGMVLAAKGDYELAMDCLDKAKSVRPNYADAWSVKGIVLGIQKRYDEAIECFDTVIGLRPDDVEAWRSKCTALNKLGRYEESIACYEKMTTLSPAIEETQRFLLEEKEKLEGAKAWFKTGVELAKSKEYGRGLERLKEAITLRPNYIDALYISGVIYGVIGEYPQAMDYFKRVLELNPEHVEALYGKGNILLKEGQPDTALELFDRVLKLSDTHVDALCDKGVALFRLERYEEALACCDIALKIAGDHQRTIALRESCVQAMEVTAQGRERSGH